MPGEKLQIKEWMLIKVPGAPANANIAVGKTAQQANSTFQAQKKAATQCGITALKLNGAGLELACSRKPANKDVGAPRRSAFFN
jgi:hypothetical protein